MATISKSWAAAAEILASDAATNAEQFSSVVDLVTDGYEGAQVTVTVNYQGSPTDYVDVNVYTSMDNSHWDTSPMFSLRFSQTPDPNTRSLLVANVGFFKVGYIQSGSTDDTNMVEMDARRWRWQSA